MVTRVRVAPDLLNWAVERAGWSDDDVVKKAPKLEAWLNADQVPTLKQLQKFAHDTHTPFGLLFLAEPPVETVPIPDMRTFGNAGVQRPTADLLDTIYICQSRQEWYRGFAVEHGLDQLEFVGSATLTTPVELVASEIRDRLDFDLSARGVFANWEDALRRLIDRIENIGVLVMVNGVVGGNNRRKLNHREFRGFALTDELAPLIFVNGEDTKAAQIFTLIHELAHIWLGGSALSDAAMTAQQGEEAELWCNRVAAEVLVPLATLRVEYRNTETTEELERLAKRFRVSTLVILKRLYDARFLDWDNYQDWYEAEASRIRRIMDERRESGGGGNYYYTQPLRLSRQFARAVIASALEGTTSFRDAYKLVGTRKHATFENLAAELGVA